jgi:hypothetical protein
MRVGMKEGKYLSKKFTGEMSFFPVVDVIGYVLTDKYQIFIEVQPIAARQIDKVAFEHVEKCKFSGQVFPQSMCDLAHSFAC